jgi:DNA-binding response OmpR family regulator
MSVQQELAARTLTSRIPIVIVTGSDIDPSTLDVACVLRKPVMPDELVSTVKRCLRRRAGQRRVASSSHRSSRGRNDLYALRV